MCIFRSSNIIPNEIISYLNVYKLLNNNNMDKKRSPQPPRTKLKTNLTHTNASDSDASVETNSLSADSANEHPKEFPQVNSNRKKNRNRRGSEWEILEGLKDGQRFEKKLDVYKGYLHKKRKWPLKGWHKVQKLYT